MGEILGALCGLLIIGLALFFISVLFLGQFRQLQGKEIEYLLKFRQRPLDSSGHRLKPIREVSTRSLILSGGDNSTWGIPEYSLRSNSDRLATYWTTTDWGLGSDQLIAGQLVEVETAEGRWIATWKLNWPHAPSLKIRLAASETYSAMLNHKFAKGYVLEFPNGRAYYWKSNKFRNCPGL